MKILGSQTSPFVRLTRVLCLELGLAFELDVTPPFTQMTPDDIAHIKSINPLMKVPALVDGDQTVLDSRIIAYYLLGKKSAKSAIKFPLSIEEENILTVIYGIIDAGILRFIMAQNNIDMNGAYMKKSLERINAGLEYLDAHPALGKNFGLCEIALVCGLEWFTKRDIVAWNHFDNLHKIHEQYKDKESLLQTRISA